VIVTRTVFIVDSLARASVFEALGGPGRPAGMIAVTQDGDRVDICFNDAVTPASLVEDLIDVAREFVPAPVLRVDRAERVRIAAWGLGEPDLDESRVLETYLPE
jgi:hypothetical protein